VQPVYFCLAENAPRVLQGLEVAEVEFPVLSVSDATIESIGAPFLDDQLEARFAEPLPVPGPPPRLIRIDDGSPDDEVDDLVFATLVCRLSNQREQVTIPALAEEAVPYLPIYGKAARKQLVDKVEASARRIALADPKTFGFLPRSGHQEFAAVAFLRDPEGKDPRGRPQAYGSIVRARTGSAKRRAQTPRPYSFDDVLEELSRTEAKVAEDDHTDVDTDDAENDSDEVEES
jgi:hypothetical protein